MSEVEKAHKDLDSCLEGVLSVLTKTKEEMVADTSVEDTDLLGYIHVFRWNEEHTDLEPVASVITERDVNKFYKAAHASLFSFSADVLTMSMEAYSSKSEINPDTGMMWESGDLAYLFSTDKEKFREYGSEAVITSAFDREGHSVQAFQSYWIEDDDTITWEETKKVDADEATDLDHLHKLFIGFMKEKSLKQTLTDDREKNPMAKMAYEALPKEVADVQTDMAAFRQIMDHELAIAVALSALPNTPRWEALDKHFSGNDPEKTGYSVMKQTSHGETRDS